MLVLTKNIQGILLPLSLRKKIDNLNKKINL